MPELPVPVGSRGGGGMTGIDGVRLGPPGTVGSGAESKSSVRKLFAKLELKGDCGT